jgi:hypothetical protein
MFATLGCAPEQLNLSDGRGNAPFHSNNARSARDHAGWRLPHANRIRRHHGYRRPRLRARALRATAVTNALKHATDIATIP